MKVFQGLIIHWLEARILLFGSVTTTEACAVFGIRRQNMANHVKHWKEISDLPVYDGSKKAFISSGSDSSLFKDEASAKKFIRALETSVSFVVASEKP